MKNKILFGRKIIFAALFMFALAIGAAAQSVTFRQGDTVQTPDGRTGKIESFKDQVMAKVRFGEGAGDTKYFMLKDLTIIAPPKPARTTPVETFRVGDIVIHPDDPNKQLRIDSISGDTAVVRYGAGNYNVYKAKLEELISLKTWERMQNDGNQQKMVRAEFEDEAEPFMQTVTWLAHTYDPKYPEGMAKYVTDPAQHEKWRKDLEALAAICGKYPNITNPANPSKDYLPKNSADVCCMAEQRTSILQKVKTKVGDFAAADEARRWIYKLNEAMQGSEGWIEDELQMLLYERAAWEKQNLQNLKKQYAKTGMVMSPDALKPLDDFVAQTKAKIESNEAQREWEKPHAADAAMEALAKRRFAADFPGAQVLKTGMTFATWKEMDTKSLAGAGIFVKCP